MVQIVQIHLSTKHTSNYMYNLQSVCNNIIIIIYKENISNITANAQNTSFYKTPLSTSLADAGFTYTEPQGRKFSSESLATLDDFDMSILDNI